MCVLIPLKYYFCIEPDQYFCHALFPQGICFSSDLKNHIMDDPEKIQKAEKLIEELADEVIHILMETDTKCYNSPKCMIPWLEEDTEHHIMSLKMDPETETRYLQKVNNLLGRYSENQPMDIR